MIRYFASMMEGGEIISLQQAKWYPDTKMWEVGTDYHKYHTLPDECEGMDEGALQWYTNLDHVYELSVGKYKFFRRLVR